MQRENEAIEHYYSLHPADFHALVRLELRQVPGCETPELLMEIELRANEDADTRRLILSFGGVKNLKFIPPQDSVLYFSFIDVASIRNRQWENVNYHVFETEQDADFSFICRDFSARVLAT